MQNDGELADARPVAWVVGETPAAIDMGAAATEVSGLRVSQRMSIEEAISAISDRNSVSLVVIDVGEVVSSQALYLLELCDEQSYDNRTGFIVVCSLSTLDVVAAYVTAPFTTILCDPMGIDYIMAISAAMLSTAGVAENDRTAETLRLLRLTDEVARIARALADLPNHASGRGNAVNDGLTGYRGPPVSPPAPVAADDIRTMIRWRRRRDTLVGDSLFADPVWDMMLDLAAAQIEGANVSVSSLCIAAAVPATTALRWIKALTDGGLFVRVPDPSDRRRVYIRLADDVSTAVLDFLGAAKSAGAGLI